MDETVWVLVIEHRHGFNHYVNRSKEGMFDTLADYCREWWGELDELYAVDLPLTRDEVIEIYFEHVYEEWFTYDEVIIKN